jgi:hypothetical protein
MKTSQMGYFGFNEKERVPGCGVLAAGYQM